MQFFMQRKKILTATLIVCHACSVVSSAETIPFRRAIELALKNSGAMSMATADQVHAHETYNEARSAFMPNLVFGSGLGYAIGVPLTLAGNAPSLFNINTQQYVLNLSQNDQVRAAMLAWKASGQDLDDRRAEVVLQAALLYTELDSTTIKLRKLQEQMQAAQHAQFISTERHKEGLDSDVDVKRAQLAAARTQLRIAEAEGNADVLRTRLGKLIGVSPDAFETVAESIPVIPEIKQDADMAAVAVDNSPLVRSVELKAQAAESKAAAERHALMPTVDFASQYSRLAAFNNYDEFYRKFTKNNYTFGVSIVFPFFSPAQRSRAAAANADAMKARRQLQEVRNAVSAETLKAQRQIRQLSAAQEVARLEYEIAEAEIDSTQAKIETGGATARDLENARVDASDRYAAYLDSNFELTKAELQLMKMTGEIQNWALPTK